MNRIIYITGMSGTGKSTIINKLKSLKYQAIDTDYDELSVLDSNNCQVLNEIKMKSIIDNNQGLLFISGCSEAQIKYYHKFHAIILLEAPLEIIKERIHSRTSNDYGKSQKEWEEIVENYRLHNESLKRSATHVIINTIPIEETIKNIIQISAQQVDAPEIVSF